MCRQFPIWSVPTVIFVASLIFLSFFLGFCYRSGMTVFVPQLLDIHTPVVNRHKDIHSSTIPKTALDCNDVLNQMTQGTWHVRPLTPKENKEMMNFSRSSAARFRLPPNFQRDDLKCGNVVFPTANMYRALCDTKGSTPCCFNSSCSRRTVSECRCAECWDLRQEKHAEYSKWVPVHPGCTYRVYKPNEVCRLINGSTLYFVGDSLVRHAYTALHLVISGDLEYGALKPGASNDTRFRCRGLHMFSEKDCRVNLKYSQKVCNGTSRVAMKYYFKSTYARQILEESLPLTSSKSLVLLGLGIHDEFNPELACNKILTPLTAEVRKRNSSWPKILWIDSHAPGLLKSPLMLAQTYDNVKSYNKEMEKCLEKLDIPVLRTFNLTDGMASFDGEHYGRGINLVKANIILQYIEQLRRNGEW